MNLRYRIRVLNLTKMGKPLPWRGFNDFHMPVTERRAEMDFTIHVPDEIGQKIKAQPDPNEFFVRAAQVALEDQMIARRLAKSSAQGRRGEYATDEVNAFFAQWSDYKA